MIKRLTLSIAIIAILCLFFLLIPTSNAYVSVPVQSGLIYDKATGNNFLAANYATLTRYDATFGGNDRYFFPGVVSHSSRDNVIFFVINSLKITVTGTKPDGSTIDGLEFCDLGWYDSPHDSGSSWDEVLTVLKDTIINMIPHGASEFLKNGMQSPDSGTGNNSTAAWVVWNWDRIFAHVVYDKGLQFRFKLHCDPDLRGAYTVQIQYYVDIWWICYGCAGRAAEQYVYDTITYLFDDPPGIPSIPSGPTSGYVGTSYSYSTSTTDPDGDNVCYQFDWSDGSTTTTGWYASGATASASHTWSSSGTYYVKVRAQDSYGAWSGWSSSLTVNIVNLEPICAMKTRTDGYFYVPNVATDILKIEMLFDNQNITGDQTGETSPYSSIQNYPDKKVDMKDVRFIAGKFGANESASGWDYMADVVPDRKIDMKDTRAVAKNFGKNGTYSKDLTGVEVTFSTGEEKLPDSNGFVVIPSGATSFNVTRSGTPIGAMILFW